VCYLGNIFIRAELPPNSPLKRKAYGALRVCVDFLHDRKSVAHYLHGAADDGRRRFRWLRAESLPEVTVFEIGPGRRSNRSWEDGCIAA